MPEDVCRICLGTPRRLKKILKMQDKYKQWTFAAMFSSLTNLPIKGNFFFKSTK